MSSFTATTNDPQTRAQRRLLFEGFNVQDTINSSRQHHSAAMMTSTPDHKLYEKEHEHLDLIQSNDSQPSESCLLQLQNARQLLHTMSRTNVLPINDQPLIEDQIPRSDLFSDTNPELAYYKSSLESERNRRKQLETLIDVQQQRLNETETELIQLRANDHKKTLCMKQFEEIIPNVVDEWKQKENDYKLKLNNLTQQIKQMDQTNREKIFHDKQQFDEQMNEKNSMIERLTKDNERIKQDYESTQLKTKQSEQRLQQQTKDSEQAKQRWSTIESDLRNEVKTAENRLNDLQSQFDKKQQEIEQTSRDHHKLNIDHQNKVRQLENELDEQRRENNVLKMELELREAKYRAQTESLKIHLIREAESKFNQRLEEQHAKHIQIEQELNEIQRRKLSDYEEKYAQILANERHEHETRIQTLLNKLEQMKNELQHVQSTTIAEREDLARKLQDVFETALFKGSTKPNIQQSDNDPTNLSTIRSLSSRIDLLVDQSNRVANGLEFNPRLQLPSQQENTSEWIENNNQNRLLSSRPQSALQSPFYRSTPIDPLHEWLPQPINRSNSADPSSSGLFSTFPSHNQQQLPSNFFSLDSNLNTNHYQQQGIPSYHSSTSNHHHHQQEVQGTISKDSIDKQYDDQTSSANESLSRYVKMLLERSPTQDNQSNNHPLAKTNRSLHDIRLSIEQLNLAERDPKVIVDDLVLHNESHSPHAVTPRPHKPASTTHTGGAKKRLDYDVHNNNNNKQSNSNELFERLSQPKTKIKKDKTQQQQQQQSSSSSSTGGHGVWK